MDTSITFSNFTEILREMIQEELGEEYEIEIKEVRKNNGLELVGMVAKKKNCNTSPAIYINDYYKEGITLAEIETVAGSICKDVQQSEFDETIDLSGFLDFKKARFNLAFKLIHTEQNKDLLTTIPHRPFLNLAITYYYAVNEAPFHGNASILIGNNHMEQWHTNEEELFQAAQQNTPLLLPWKMDNMETVMEKLLEIEKEDSNPTFPMYVLSNQQKLLGAACLLYPGVLQQCAEELNGNFYVLPSSIHEVILMPEDKCTCADELIDIVTEINHTQVAPDEVLADSVYFYNSEDDKLVQLC